MDGAEQAAVRNGSTGQAPAGALIQLWRLALIDGNGQSFLKLQDVVLSQLHSAGAEQSLCLPCVQPRSCVSADGLQPEQPQRKTRGLHLPHPTLQQSSGKGGDWRGQSKEAEGKTRREQSMQRQLFVQNFCKSKGQKMHQKN